MQPSKDRNSSFDKLVRTGLQRWRNIESECVRGLKIDHQFERSRLHDRKIRRLGSLKNAGCVYACLPVGVRNIRTVADEATFRYIITKWIDRGVLSFAARATISARLLIKKGSVPTRSASTFAQQSR
jgi:hypothetical protein